MIGFGRLPQRDEQIANSTMREAHTLIFLAIFEGWQDVDGVVFAGLDNEGVNTLNDEQELLLIMTGKDARIFLEETHKEIIIEDSELGLFVYERLKE